ncbi:nucleotidyltransferase-like protein [Microbacterium saperdae]|uniref:Nucleotidyltransferase-like protein n=2 Tax=Microbacterium saperdae TaxID=69368 RepID=A0A543BNM0_9MICO|nr:nucleotidyltransferase-like protein [Microbacterium saperdae]
MLGGMEQLPIVERFIAAHFPRAGIAVVAGSTARGTRTRTSDIDLLLIGDDIFETDAASFAGGFEFEGGFFEVFAYTVDGYGEWAARGVAQFRPVIVHMLVEGIEVRGGTALQELRHRWERVLVDGPRPTAHELEFRRYMITDQLDDLRDAQDPLERRVIAGLLFERTAELMLLGAGHWIGAGKYLPRRLCELSVDRTEALAAPLLQGDFDEFATQVERELDAAGGRVQAGFVR